MAATTSTAVTRATPRITRSFTQKEELSGVRADKSPVVPRLDRVASYSRNWQPRAQISTREVREVSQEKKTVVEVTEKEESSFKRAATLTNLKREPSASRVGMSALERSRMRMQQGGANRSSYSRENSASRVARAPREVQRVSSRNEIAIVESKKEVTASGLKTEDSSYLRRISNLSTANHVTASHSRANPIANRANRRLSRERRREAAHSFKDPNSVLLNSRTSLTRTGELMTSKSRVASQTPNYRPKMAGPDKAGSPVFHDSLFGLLGKLKAVEEAKQNLVSHSSFSLRGLF